MSGGVSGGAVHPAIAELLASKRLGSLEASRHRFTVSREEALLRLRDQVRERGEQAWDWTRYVVRAANALSEIAEAELEIQTDEQFETTTIDVVTPGTELTRLDLADILGGALEADLGEPLAGAEPEQRLARFRMLIGRAINGALAHDRVSIELSTPAGGRRFERREPALEGRDPYVERKLAGLAGDARSRFVIRIVEPRPGLGSRLGRWLSRKSDRQAELAALWRGWRVRDREGDNVEAGKIALGPALTGEPVELGGHALFGSCRAVAEAPALLRGSLWLVRDGVTLLDLGPAVREHRIDPAAVAGWIDCPSLRLTADERSVARDGNFELLVAWLNDFLARSDASGAVSWPDSLGEGPETASGRPISPEQLGEEARRGRELIYVWRHQAAEVPAYAKAKIVTLWPSELRLIRARYPDLRLVPLRAFGGHSDFDPADLTALQTGSYAPLAILKASPIGGEPGAGALSAVLRLSIDAYVHRAPTATMGFIEILAYERRVLQVRERNQVFPGVTLICRLDTDGPELDVASLRRDHVALGKIAEIVRERTRAHWEALLAHVMRAAERWSAWETPLLRTALEELGPAAIDLRYQSIEPQQRTSAPRSSSVRLAWRDSVLLDVEIGRDASGANRQLRDALRQIREPGFLVLAHDIKRYDNLRSKNPLLQPWSVPEWAKPLLERVLGRATILEMPVVPEAHPLVLGDPVEDQRHLVHQRATIQQTLERANTDPLARLRLLGHLLVARALDQDTFGLETVPLLDRYDPRALTPTRLVSLSAVLAERPRPGLVPAGSVHRGLARPMIEAPPGLAALLAEVAGLEPGLTSAAPRLVETESTERSAPVRRRARGVAPLLASSVVHPLAIGRLVVAGDGSSEGIALWARGLRVGELELPEPLGRVSGRLLLTDQGQRIDRNVVSREITGLARQLLADALRQRTLLPPDGPQRRKLDHFVDYARSVVAREDKFNLANELGVSEPVDRGARFTALRQLSLRAAPLRPLSNRREALLVDIVRQSVAMQLSFDTAVLSWRPAKLERRRPDGSFEIEFGLRNAWIQRALDEDKATSPEAQRHAAMIAGVLTVFAFFEDARAGKLLDVRSEHVVVALWRLLQL